MPGGNKILARNIKQARHNMGITQQQAADLLGITQLHYGRLERGERRASLEQIEDIARAFQTSPYSLLDGCFKEYPQSTIRQIDASQILKNLYALLVNCSQEEQLLCYDLCERIARGR